MTEPIAPQRFQRSPKFPVSKTAPPSSTASTGVTFMREVVPHYLSVHGFMGYSFSWRFVIRGLAQHYSVYAVDLPNCGFSQRSASLPGTLVERRRAPAELHGPPRHRAVRRAGHLTRRRSNHCPGRTAGRARHATSRPQAGACRRPSAHGCDTAWGVFACCGLAWAESTWCISRAGSRSSSQISSASSTPTRPPFLRMLSPATRQDLSLRAASNICGTSPAHG